MAETRRVLKPGGTLRFAEHVRAEGAYGKLLDAATPVWKRVLAGCHPNRRTLDAIRAAGFSTAEIERGRLSGVLPLVSGVARPAAVPVAPGGGRER